MIRCCAQTFDNCCYTEVAAARYDRVASFEAALECHIQSLILDIDMQGCPALRRVLE
jgi:hypothetical protein